MPDAAIAAAIRAYWTDTHNLIEGAGAAPLAALVQERDRMAGRKVGLVASGGNIDLALFRSWSAARAYFYRVQLPSPVSRGSDYGGSA
ncbi:MAG: hypothetical protein U1E70_14360 [Acetobacteraceae bacterium]